jgi:glycolate oxidase FAD binding subunit
MLMSWDNLSVRTPASVAELRTQVQGAVADQMAVYPRGGSTMLDLGLPPIRPGRALDLRKLDQVIDYPARDMTVTVQAGITITHLQELLAKENQRLPVDVHLPDQATLGGSLATNTSGARRYGFGTLRDYVIGISVVNDKGEEVKAGGRVVKNVAGYDLCKLYIGSLGTLGIITQATLKLRPLPEAQAMIALACDLDRIDRLLSQVHSSRTRPVCVDLLNPAAAKAIAHASGKDLPTSAWVVLVGFEENEEAVRWQVQQLQQESAGAAQTVWTGADVDPLWRGLADFPHRSESALTFKANLLPSATAGFCRETAGLCERLLLQAHAGNGIVIGHVDGDLTLELAREILNPLLAAATAAQGNLVILRRPTAWKTVLPVWGSPRCDHWLMRIVKEKLDPGNLFNPGRFVDGI